MCLQITHAPTLIRLFVFNFVSRFSLAQFIPICPIGFVWGGYCGIGLFSQCPPSLPPFHCISGSCCRDQRPLIARLGPILYPWNLGIGRGVGIPGIGTGTGVGIGFPGGSGLGFPNGFPGIGGPFGNSGASGFCIDNALNCFAFVIYCQLPQYQLCMALHCRRSCGYCFGGIVG